MATFIKNKKFLLILFLLFFVSSSTALALEVDWPLSPGGTVLNDDSDIGDMVQYFYEWAIALGGLATFISLVSGGFKYLSSMGRPEVMNEAKSQITSAFAGLILLLSSWLILNTINPDLTTFNRRSFDLEWLLENPPFIGIRELPGCDYAILYETESFGGDTLKIPGKVYPNDDKLTGKDGYFVVGVGKAGSVQSFSKASLEDFGCTTPDCACEGHACGCVLELYAAGYDEETDQILDCGDKLGEIPAWDKDVLGHEGQAQEINCVRLTGIACQCREQDPVTGECSTDIAPDTVWGDERNDDFNCLGTNQEANNSRCLGGKCIICGGKIYSDGCGGCANRKIVPGYTGSSNLACWYAGRKSGTEFADSCDTVCTQRAHKDAYCVQANWNDTNNCTVAKLFGGCSCAWVHSALPGTPWTLVDWWTNPFNWKTICERRGDYVAQRCSDVGYWYGKRICVCDR